MVEVRWKETLIQVAGGKRRFKSDRHRVCVKW